MINLNQSSTRTVQYLTGSSVTSSVVTDTLFVRDVLVDFSSRSLHGTVERGTMVNGAFVPNSPPVKITVNPDGSFISDDGEWRGSLASVPDLVAQLQSTFDQFVIAAGLVEGTIA